MRVHTYVALFLVATLTLGVLPLTASAALIASQLDSSASATRPAPASVYLGLGYVPPASQTIYGVRFRVNTSGSGDYICPVSTSIMKYFGTTTPPTQWGTGWNVVGRLVNVGTTTPDTNGFCDYTTLDKFDNAVSLTLSPSYYYVFFMSTGGSYTKWVSVSGKPYTGATPSLFGFRHAFLTSYEWGTTGLDAPYYQFYDTAPPALIVPTLSVTNSPVAYDGSAHAAAVSGSVAGSVSNIKYNGSATAPTDPATYAVTADFTPTDTNNYSILTGASAGNFVISAADQTITFNALSDKTLGDADFDVSATASSGLTVTFTSQTTDVCSMSTTTVHLAAAGTCTIRASQAGNTNYNAAADVERSFTVNPARTNPTLSVTNSPVAYNGSPQSATVVGSVDGTVSNVLYSGSTTVPTTAATYAITADFLPTDTAHYNSLTGASAGNFVISAADQTITFNALSDKTLGDADFDVSATASSGLTVTFTSQTTDVCSMSTTTVHLAAAGTCTIRASQAGNTNYNAAADVERSFTVSPAPVTPRRIRPTVMDRPSTPVQTAAAAPSVESTTSSAATTESAPAATESSVQQSAPAPAETATVPTIASPIVESAPPPVAPPTVAAPEALGESLLAAASPVIKKVLAIVPESTEPEAPQYVSVNIPNGPIYITDVATGVTKEVSEEPEAEDTIAPQTASVFDASEQASFADLRNVLYAILIALLGISLLSYAVYKIKQKFSKPDLSNLET